MDPKGILYRDERAFHQECLKKGHMAHAPKGAQK
jgi:hypothetical protein